MRKRVSLWVKLARFLIISTYFYISTKLRNRRGNRDLPRCRYDQCPRYVRECTAHHCAGVPSARERRCLRCTNVGAYPQIHNKPSGGHGRVRGAVEPSRLTRAYPRRTTAPAILSAILKSFSLRECLQRKGECRLNRKRFFIGSKTS